MRTQASDASITVIISAIVSDDVVVTQRTSASRCRDYVAVVVVINAVVVAVWLLLLFG